MGREGRGPGRRRGIWAVVLVVLGSVFLVGGTVVVVVLGGDTYSKRSIPSESMAPTYDRGDQVWIEQAGPARVRRGDPVLVTPPPAWQTGGDVLKRIIAVGGDRISWSAGDAALKLNGQPLPEPYLKHPGVPAAAPFDVTVPEGRIFVMGDHRTNSFDSHLRTSDGNHGTLPLSAVRGVPVATPTAVVTAATVCVAGLPLFLVGGGLGVAALVARRRAAKAAPGPGHAAWAYGTPAG
ncbi:signal peptidase I [Streptomyces sp. NPDC056883]|uniref:signal peptidase I n=1 Tax=Streptomyces sp. NPDC056883 TaxID=3345959 RepID=UPI0036CA7AF8